jgi:DNA-3-methyladenine glycosylase I
MNDAGIVRNRLKINATIINANRILSIQSQHGSFKHWLDEHRHFDKAEWTRLFKKHFVFTGGEIVNEFLMSTGYLDVAHHIDCPIHQKIG